MSYTSGNSSKASEKEVKTNEEVKMGFTVNVTIPRIENDKIKDSNYGLIVRSGEYKECDPNFEHFSIGAIGDCEIIKDENNKIVEVNTEKSKFVLAKNGKYVRAHKTRKNEER